MITIAPIAQIELADEDLEKVVGGCGGYERRGCDDGGWRRGEGDDWRGSEYGDPDRRRGCARSHREHESWEHDSDDVRINIL